MRKICVIGLGYIGLPTATMFATHGYNVVGVDINPEVVESLNQGKIHIELEPEMKELSNYSATPKITGNLKIFRFLKIENLVDFQ
ncbi:exported hypothetical protein [groundwater metagenome]|uniref:UDP-glucose/GDP-mannose dehydrogenase N-terminal domain-containing protein n=1 Tax=groundwater metagenome TaxID=717931 RepID=A0A098E8V7_9ZZZZ